MFLELEIIERYERIESGQNLSIICAKRTIIAVSWSRDGRGNAFCKFFPFIPTARSNRALNRGQAAQRNQQTRSLQHTTKKKSHFFTKFSQQTNNSSVT